MTTVPRRPAAKKKLDLKDLAARFAEFRRLKNLESDSKKDHERLRDEVLMPALVTAGTAWGEHQQHLAIELPEPVDGFVRLVRRANVSRSIDVEEAERVAKARGFLEEIQTVTVSVSFTGPPAEARRVAGLLDKAREGIDGVELRVGEPQFSQERMMAFHQRSKGRPGKAKLTEADLDAFVVEDTTYSFFPEKS